MNGFLFAAGILAIIVGIVHSVLGELMIFRHLRIDSVVPTRGSTTLRERNVRIIWATWHIASIFGWAMAAILLYLSQRAATDASEFFVLCIAWAMCLCGLLVFIATKAAHPGWVGLITVAILCWLA